MARANVEPRPLLKERDLDPDLLTAIRWQATGSGDEIIADRAKLFENLMQAARDLRGHHHGWLCGESVNAAFAEHCCCLAAFENPNCLNHLRFGAPLIGQLGESVRRGKKDGKLKYKG